MALLNYSTTVAADKSATQVQGALVRGGARRLLTERIAWRILLAWVQAQLAVIETGMVTMDQVFLPYLLLGPERTLYQEFIERDLPLALGPGD